jgi:hypothetical protein
VRAPWLLSVDHLDSVLLAPLIRLGALAGAVFLCLSAKCGRIGSDYAR